MLPGDLVSLLEPDVIGWAVYLADPTSGDFRAVCRAHEDALALIISTNSSNYCYCLFSGLRMGWVLKRACVPLAPTP